MESPQHIGDSTANSILAQLGKTHVLKPNAKASSAQPGVRAASVQAAVYLGQKYIQFEAQFPRLGKSALVLRRVRDSFVNVSQLLAILVLLDNLSQDQADGYISNHIINSTQYRILDDSLAPLYNDYRTHVVKQLRGIWVPYDKAVAIAAALDLYSVVKPLLLVDVHDYEALPRADDASKRSPESELDSATPSKRQKTEPREFVAPSVADNPNLPYCLPPLSQTDISPELVSEVEVLFSDIFKNDAAATAKTIEAQFRPVFDKLAKLLLLLLLSLWIAQLDVPLDSLGKTALHYAATLASLTLVAAFVDLKICSPIRGDHRGESPLVSLLQVTNSMEKGNFIELLDDYLWPDLWLLDKHGQSVVHHIVGVAKKNARAARFYFSKIVEWLASNPSKDRNLQRLVKLIDAQDSQAGDTALHIAAEKDLKWFIYVLLELKADPTVKNNAGVKPEDYDCVAEIQTLRKLLEKKEDFRTLFEQLDVQTQEEEYLLDLLLTGVAAATTLEQYPDVGTLEEVSGKAEDKATSSNGLSDEPPSAKIYQSIQDLLASTHNEYQALISTKKAEINKLHAELRDATIVTANNKFALRKILDKISKIDTMKLQMANMNERLEIIRKDLQLVDGGLGEDFDSEDIVKFDADEPFIIHPIYDLLKRGEAVDPTPEILEQLPGSEILQARLHAYQEVNLRLEKELAAVLDYSALTAKFKRVVSFCTGVDINEVDELLDGLLEAVEGQQ